HQLLSLIQKLLLWQVLRISEGSYTARYDAYLHQRVSMLQEPSCHGVSCFVIGHDLFLFRRNDFIFLFQPPDHPVDGVLEVLHVDGFLILPRSDECGFVADVGNFGPGKTRSLCRQLLCIYFRIEFQGLQVYLENCLTAYNIRLVDADLPVEASWPQQGRIQYIRPVGGSQDDYT